MKQIYIYTVLLVLLGPSAWGQAGRLHRLAGPDTTVVATRSYADSKVQIVNKKPTSDSSILKIYRDPFDNDKVKVVDSKTGSVKSIYFDRDVSSTEEMSLYNGFWNETIRYFHNRGEYRVTSVPVTSVDSLFVVEINNFVSENWLYHSEEISNTDNASQVAEVGGATWINSSLTTTNDVLVNKEGRKTADMHVLGSATAARFQVSFVNPDTLFPGDIMNLKMDVLLGEAASNKNVTMQVRATSTLSIATTNVILNTGSSWQETSTDLILTDTLFPGNITPPQNKFNLFFLGDIGDTVYTSRAQLSASSATDYIRTINRFLIDTSRYFAEYVINKGIIDLNEIQPFYPYMSDNQLLQKAIDYCAYNDLPKFIFLKPEMVIDSINLYGNTTLLGTHRENNSLSYTGVSTGTTLRVTRKNPSGSLVDAITFDNPENPADYDRGPAMIGIEMIAEDSVRSLINIKRAGGNVISDITLDGGNVTQYAMSSIFDFTDPPGIGNKIDRVRFKNANYGFYGPRSKIIFYDCHFIALDRGIYCGANLLTAVNTQFEDINFESIIADVSENENNFDKLVIDHCYFENNSNDGAGAVIRLSDIDNFLMTKTAFNHSVSDDTLIVMNSVKNLAIKNNELNTTPRITIWQDTTEALGVIEMTGNSIRHTSANSFINANRTIKESQLIWRGNTALTRAVKNYSSDENVKELESSRSYSVETTFGGRIRLNQDTITGHYQNLVNTSGDPTFLANANYNQTGTGTTLDPWGNSISSIVAFTSTQTTASNYIGVKIGETLDPTKVYTISLYGALRNDNVQAPSNASSRYLRPSAGTVLFGQLGPVNDTLWQRYEIQWQPASAVDSITLNGLAFVSGDTLAITGIQLEEYFTSTRYIETTGTHVNNTNPKWIIPNGSSFTIEGTLNIEKYKDLIPIPYNAVDTIVIDTINTAFALTPDLASTSLRQVIYTTNANVTGDLSIRLLYYDVSANTYTPVGAGTITTGNNQVTVSGLSQSITSGDFLYTEVTASAGGGPGTTPANGLSINLRFQ